MTVARLCLYRAGRSLTAERSSYLFESDLLSLDELDELDESDESVESDSESDESESLSLCDELLLRSGAGSPGA